MICFLCGKVQAEPGGAYCLACFEEIDDAFDRFEELCPDRYRIIEARLLPNPELTRKVLRWQEDDHKHKPHPESFGHDKPGLLLLGAPRTGKTLTMYALLRKLMTRYSGDTFQVYRGVQWAREVVERSKTGEVGDWLDPQLDCGYLVIDDFDKAKFTPKVAEVFYEILEGRFSKGMTVLLTCNSNGDQLLMRMPEEYGPAIVGRLRDFCTVVRFERVVADNNSKSCDKKATGLSLQAKQEIPLSRLTTDEGEPQTGQ
jgi:hypothetical protein